MKKKSLITKEKRNLFLYAINYAINYLKCILIEAQMEKVAIDVYVNGKTDLKCKLFRLNKKCNKFTNILFMQKSKLEIMV